MKTRQYLTPLEMKYFRNKLWCFTITGIMLACATTLTNYLKQKPEPPLHLKPMIKGSLSTAAFIFNALVWYLCQLKQWSPGQVVGYCIMGLLIVMQSPQPSGFDYTTQEFVFQNYCVMGLLILFAYHLSPCKLWFGVLMTIATALNFTFVISITEDWNPIETLQCAIFILISVAA